MRCALVVVTVAAAVLFLAGPAPLQADQIAASNGTGSSAHTSYSSGGDGWEVRDPGGGNQDVYYNPDAGPWGKTFGAIQGGAEDGHVYQLTEMLHVSGGPEGTAPAWTDFHETIVTPGWTWSPNDAQHQWGFSAIHDPPWLGNWWYVIPMGNKDVQWSFSAPLPVCTQLTLTKWLVFDAEAEGADPLVPLVVDEYPTIPEPASMSLLAIGGLGILLRLRKK